MSPCFKYFYDTKCKNCNLIVVKKIVFNKTVMNYTRRLPLFWKKKDQILVDHYFERLGGGWKVVLGLELQLTFIVSLVQRSIFSIGHMTNSNFKVWNFKFTLNCVFWTSITLSSVCLPVSNIFTIPSVKTAI